jgi:ABC-type ATPase with predicted acetyltransferase domain
MTRRREFFEITRWARRYDRESGKFVVNISYETAAPKPTKRVVAVAESFGLGLDKWERFVVYDNVELKIGPRDIVLITGDSGSGKSVLLKALEKDIKEGMNAESINMGDVQLDPCKPLIETVGKTVEEGLELLSKVGLNDAFLFLRTFEQLSDGQKYRYGIAKMMESEAQFWIMDEFAATLDRDTAKIVAFNVQKLARQEGKAVLAATTHNDLFEDLKPSVHVHKRFGREIEVKYYANEINKECSLVKEMNVIEGSRQDYYQLASFHYRSHKVAGVRKIFSLKRDEELCGVAVYSYPPAACFGRRMVLPRMSMREMNEKLSIISRVVVHPKYRTIGLGHKLIRETLMHAGTPYVETVAVMAKYNPFFEKAGMRKIAESQPVKETSEITEVLKKLGFNATYLRSPKYTLKKLAGLNAQELKMLRIAFSRNKHPRFMKEFSFHDPYGRSKFYKKAVETADAQKLAKLTSICGMLLQTKVYLFWSSA